MLRTRVYSPSSVIFKSEIDETEHLKEGEWLLRESASVPGLLTAICLLPLEVQVATGKLIQGQRFGYVTDKGWSLMTEKDPEKLKKLIGKEVEAVSRKDGSLLEGKNFDGGGQGKSQGHHGSSSHHSEFTTPNPLISKYKFTLCL
ncbi:hypothetical protein [Legionella cardiaca]|uniref:Uncharacterized protein n=1 Tax=Legionella cardiaca TaxID=1071983 RepID=A0ABY8APL4_9GAMM|nr:hypothetical protein [Legionella cardiaca]WED42650.1 hypothetical protein PXX05_12180 [Legionella cardiaca]